MNTPVNPLDPQGSEGVLAAVKDVVENIETRLENIKAIKGENFSNFVQFCVAFIPLVDFMTNAPQPVARAMSPILVAKLMKQIADICKLSKEESMEAFDMSKNIGESMEANVNRIKGLFG